MKNVKAFIKRMPFAASIYRTCKFLARIPGRLKLYIHTKNAISQPRGKARVYYIGIPAHNNLGDLAQGVCIRRWLAKHYPDRQVVEIETNALVNTPFSVKNVLKKTFRDEDLIVFQSGYTTTDLGGYADEMHRCIMELLPQARMLMMPQTIYFQSEERKLLTSSVYDGTQNLLFLARDQVSYEMAKEMFPHRQVEVYPDIVTTLIGQYDYDGPRDGILLCCRDDSEKFYSDRQLDELVRQCSAFAPVDRTDTTKRNHRNIVSCAESHILAEIERYSRYRLMITDRYHGTIFSLVAGTPVIIIQTTDHKVTTGAAWFKGIYDNHVYVANSLEHAYELAKVLYHARISHKLQPYFETNYYDRLPDLFAQIAAKDSTDSRKADQSS